MNEKRQLTQAMIDVLNDKLYLMGMGIYYVPWEFDSSIPGMQVQVRDTKNFIHSSIVNFTNDYFEWLNNFFKTTFDIELAYNNTGSICWAK